MCVRAQLEERLERGKSEKRSESREPERRIAESFLTVQLRAHPCVLSTAGPDDRWLYERSGRFAKERFFLYFGSY